MDQRPIGVFDSGLGGLTAVKALRQLLPGEDLIYLGDTARVPYGQRDRDTLIAYSRQDVRFLRQFDVKAILIACGTATTAALPALRQENDLPILGVVEAACHRAAAATQNGRVGMIATQASVHSGVYETTLRGLLPAVEWLAVPCPDLVTLVEHGRFHREDPAVLTTARAYLAPLGQAGIDTLILGCTHFPLLREVIAEVMGPDVTLIDAGGESAVELSALLREQDLLAVRRQGSARFYVSGPPEDFDTFGAMFLGEPAKLSAERIDIEQY